MSRSALRRRAVAWRRSVGWPRAAPARPARPGRRARPGARQRVRRAGDPAPSATRVRDRRLPGRVRAAGPEPARDHAHLRSRRRPGHGHAAPRTSSSPPTCRSASWSSGSPPTPRRRSGRATGSRSPPPRRPRRRRLPVQPAGAAAVAPRAGCCTSRWAGGAGRAAGHARTCAFTLTLGSRPSTGSAGARDYAWWGSGQPLLAWERGVRLAPGAAAAVHGRERDQRGRPDAT